MNMFSHLSVMGILWNGPQSHKATVYYASLILKALYAINDTVIFVNLAAGNHLDVGTISGKISQQIYNFPRRMDV